MALKRVFKDVFIVGAKRTPIGAYGGKLMKMSPTDLQAVAATAALAQAGVEPGRVASIVVGNVFHTTKDGAYLPRHVGLRIGVPVEVPALIVNRLCGSGFQSIVSGAGDVELDGAAVVLTGGAENMSLSPHAVRGARFGVKLGLDLVLEDTLWHGLTDQHIKTPMGVTAENLAEKYGISRLEANEFAIRSLRNWKKAQDSGVFEDEMAAIMLKTRKGEELMGEDEHPKPETTLEAIERLPTIFKKNGTVNAANASGICDGASAVVLASARGVSQCDLQPLSRLVGYAVSGCEPSVMGIGPVPAVEALLAVTGRTKAEVDYFEINEAFAPQFLACQKALDLDPEKCNVNGGAIAMGHPVGMSGNRIIGHLSHFLRKTNKSLAVGAACIGGGQGIAVMIENVK